MDLFVGQGCSRKHSAHHARCADKSLLLSTRGPPDPHRRHVRCQEGVASERHVAGRVLEAVGLQQAQRTVADLVVRRDAGRPQLHL